MRRQLPLPVDALIPDILASLQRTQNLVIEAEPGAGKTTRIPPALLGAFHGQVLVLEPRRIAARLAARRVAWELEEEVGETVGFQVRFERVAGPNTRLHFMTEGVLTRRLLSDPDLNGVDAVVLDEFHERHLETDLALSLLTRLQRRRPDLRLIVMSATMDAAPVARFLGECPMLNSKGRLFDLSIEHTPYSPAPLEEQIRGAVERMLPYDDSGEILIFLPGAAEIRRALRACEGLARSNNRLLLALHGDLPASEQDRAVAPAPQPKIIFSTNVAESSITIDGVRTVIDSGLARIAAYSPWSGLPTLRIGRISKASARQRAGRAARTAAGRVIRLYSQMDYQARADYDAPEILRSDLTQLCLALRAMGIPDPATIEWLDAPPEIAVRSAENLLELLVSDEDARQLMRLPLHPRLSRMIAAATERGAGRAACITAALLSSGERLQRNELLAALDEPLSEATKQQLRHLLHLIHPSKRSAHDDDALLQSVLMGFPDRVAQRKGANQVLLSNGTAAEIVGPPPPFPLLVALDAEDRTEKPLPQVRLFARVEPEWLLDHFPEHVREETAVIWNRQAERVDSVSRLVYQKLILQESQNAAPDQDAVAELLAQKALELGIERFVDEATLDDLLGRLEFAGIKAPDIATSFKQFCRGYRSFAELKTSGKDFGAWLERSIDQGRLQRDAPRTLRLNAGRQAKIHYERGKTPWIASRLQDFFGMDETPRLGARRTPVVLHLLAPNQRAVQTTTDLAGFWARLYPQVRRDLMRRYPRHSWPEDPRH